MLTEVFNSGNYFVFKCCCYSNRIFSFGSVIVQNS
ncbi:DUF1496 domain-containing protein [Mesobacillus subterraneus]